MEPSPKKPSEVLSELTVACSAEFTKWPSAEMKAWYKESLISLLLEAKGRMPKMKRVNKTIGYPAFKQGRNDALAEAHAVLSALIEEVNQS